MSSSPSPAYRYAAEVLEVIDGDTIDVRVDLGFNVFNKLRVRLLGIDTAEVYGTEEESRVHKIGDHQTQFVKDWLAGKDQIILRTYKDETGKYGRYLGEVYGDGEQLSDALRSEFEDYFAGRNGPRN